MDRYILTDAQWGKMEPFCLGKVTDRGRSGKDNRLFLEAVLWIGRTDSPWRDLPAHFGKWNTVFKRYRDWVKADVFEAIFASVKALLHKDLKCKAPLIEPNLRRNLGKWST